MKTIRLFFFLTLITGIIYPLSVTFMSQFLFPEQSNGSLIQKKGEIIGSTLIGQAFQNEKYFWPRPSAVQYNPMPSGASNLGITSLELQKAIQDRKERWKSKIGGEVPSDLLCASASGLDPHISPEAALFQISRVAEARKLKVEDLEKLVRTLTENRTFAVLGEPRINVLRLNLALDGSGP